MVATERAAGMACLSCTALCPASPSFLECTPNPRHLEGGTCVVLLRARGTLGERLNRGRALGGMNVQERKEINLGAHLASNGRLAAIGKGLLGLLG